MESLVHVGGPEIEIALLRCVGGGICAWTASLAEERKETRGAFAIATSNDDERPGHLPLVIMLFAIIDRAEERPEDRR